MRAYELLEGRSTPCIVVDIQPAYEPTSYGQSHFEIFRNAARFLNNQTGPILMFVNAESDKMTRDTVQDIKIYWEEKLGVTPDFWNRVTIDDKGYGYLRSWMDAGMKEKTIIKTIRLMYQNKINDSRELFGGDESDDYEINMRAWLDDDYQWTALGDPLYIEWTSVAQLKKFNGSYIMGGGRNECLKEVELLMNAFNIKYKEIQDFIYG